MKVAWAILVFAVMFFMVMFIFRDTYRGKAGGVLAIPRQEPSVTSKLVQTEVICVEGYKFLVVRQDARDGVAVAVTPIFKWATSNGSATPMECDD